MNLSVRPHFNSVFDLQINNSDRDLFDHSLNFVINGKKYVVSKLSLMLVFFTILVLHFFGKDPMMFCID